MSNRDRTQRAGARRRISAAIAGLLLSVAMVVASGAQPAAAATAWPSHSSYTYSSTGVSNVRTCASTGCPVRYSLSNYRTVWMLCWTDSQWAYGNYGSNRWFYIYSSSGYGYIHSSLVSNQASSPRC